MNPGNLLLMKQGAKSSQMGTILGDKVKYVTSSVFPKWKVFLLSRKAVAACRSYTSPKRGAKG